MKPILSIFFISIVFLNTCNGQNLNLQDICNNLVISKYYYKNILFKKDTSCHFNQKLYLLNKDSVVITQGLIDREIDFFSKKKQSDEIITSSGNLVFFSTGSTPHFNVGLINNNEFLTLEKIKVDSTDDLRGLDFSLNMSYEYFLVRQDEEFIIYNILSDEGGSFRVKISLVKINNKKISIENIFLSPFFYNYYNNSYCEDCSFFENRKNKLYIKTSPQNQHDLNEDLNFKKYQKTILFELNLKNKSVSIGKRRYNLKLN